MWARAGYLTASHNTHFLPRTGSSTGWFIHLRTGGGKDTVAKSRYAPNSSLDRLPVMLCVRSSAMTDCLSDLLGTQTDDMIQPRAAATVLVALITVVARSSESDLPFLSAATAAVESKLKDTNWPMNLCGHSSMGVR